MASAKDEHSIFESDVIPRSFWVLEPTTSSPLHADSRESRQYGIPYSAMLRIHHLNSSLSDSSGRNTPTASGHSSSAKQSCSSVVTEMTDDQDLEHISQALEPNGSIHLCFFSFNGCTFASQNVMQWKSHCTEHFKEQELLPSMDCFLCEFRADTTEEGTAWAQILHHTAVEHKNGQRTMPTEGLLRFLLQLGIIEKSLSKKGTDPDSSSLNPNSSSSRPDRSLDFRAINIFGQSIHKSYDMAVDLKSVEYQPDMLINGRVTMKDSFDDDFTSSEEESDEDEYTSEEEDELDPLDVVNKQIIKRTLENLHWALPTTPSSARSCTTNSSGGSKRSGSISRPSGNGKGRVPPGLLGSSNNHEFPQDADGEGEGNPRQGRTLSTAADAKQSRFACPFYQKDPQKHQKYRSCVGPGFETVHRVKAHLYKRHQRPIQCVRCWEIFSSDSEYKEHLRAVPTCEVKEEAKAEGIDKTQEAALKSKKRPSGTISEVEKWRQMYKIVFPDDYDIPSPFYFSGLEISQHYRAGSEDFTNFEAYQRRELRRRLAQRVDDLLAKDYAPLGESLARELLNAVEACNTDILEDFRQSQRTLPSASGANSSQQGVNLPSISRISIPQTADSFTAEDSLSQMFMPPPPPPPTGFGATSYQPDFLGLTSNRLQQQDLGSSQNSKSKALSESSASARRTSMTSYSGFLPSQQGQLGLTDPILGIPDDSALNPQQRMNEREENPTTGPEDIQYTAISDFGFNPDLSPDAHNMLQNPYNTIRSDFQGTTLYPNYESLGNAQPSGSVWTLPSFQPQNSTNYMFPEAGSSFSTRWTPQLSQEARTNDKNFGQNNLGQGDDRDPEPLRPRKRKQT